MTGHVTGRTPGFEGSGFDQRLSLAGERVALRPFRPDDAGVLGTAMAAGEEFLPPIVPPPGEAMDWWLRTGVHDIARSGMGLHSVVEDAATGELSGAIGIFRVDAPARAAEAGYGIRPGARGRGLATDALRTLAGWALRDGGLNRIELRIDVTNHPSIRVAEKAGFQREGILRAAGSTAEGEAAIDQHVFSLLASDLEERERGTPAKRLVGVGVGPGDPELVTVQGIRALQEADVVLVPVMALDEEGRAESVVRAYTGKAERVVFALNDRGGVTSRRAKAWDAAAERVVRAFDEGAGTVAFATIGDPNVYSTFTYLAQTVRELRPETEIATVPGITAMQDLAARSGTVLAEGSESIGLVPLTGGVEAFRTALETGDTVVAYKFGSVAGEVIEVLKEAGRLDGACYGARLGLPGEEIRPARELAGPVPHLSTLPYLSTLIVPGRRTARGGRL
ncbi:precorrin-2 C(20)-methyltransferase [Actinomadura sp. 9N407]|uniref:precorrin-2 C(20)-methyltransferase n=1 Tax=Actinomadura sp. 9N407 TaxID=3375154 RepID=UPI00379F5107